MENKLQELTQKLYDQGLSKGREQAEGLVADAEQKAAKIIADAQAKAQSIIKEAEKQGEELTKNTASEIAMASQQSIATLKEAISSMIITDATSSSVGQACLDTAFVKELLLAVANAWQGASSQKSELIAQLPEAKQAEFKKAFSANAKQLLSDGVEIVYSSGVKSGFKISPKNGAYYISFTDADFKALLEEFLRPKVAKIIFEK